MHGDIFESTKGDSRWMRDLSHPCYTLAAGRLASGDPVNLCKAAAPARKLPTIGTMDSHSPAQRTGSELLHLLADGATHAGPAIAARLGVSRAAVWKQVEQLRALGVQVDAQRGLGYRLPAPLELLNAASIRAAAPDIDTLLEIHWQLDSTNSELMRRAAAGMPDRLACLAEVQTQGRGRRGRTWQTPLAGALALSLLCRFESGMGSLAGLSLVAGVALVAALEDCGIHGAGLKWPNDVLLDGGKLAGVLIELGGEALGPCYAVIGVGVNTGAVPTGVDQQAAALGARKEAVPSRNQLAGRLLAQLNSHVDRFARSGFGAFADAYAHRDVLAGRPLSVHWPDRRIDALGVGVDPRGALLVEVEGERMAIDSGEVSIRAH